MQQFCECWQPFFWLIKLSVHQVLEVVHERHTVNHNQSHPVMFFVPQLLVFLCLGSIHSDTFQSLSVQAHRKVHVTKHETWCDTCSDYFIYVTSVNRLLQEIITLIDIWSISVLWSYIKIYTFMVQKLVWIWTIDNGDFLNKEQNSYSRF